MLNSFANELVEQFNIRFGYSSAPQAMANELIQANLKIEWLRRALERAERNNSYGGQRGNFLTRTCPYEAIRNPKPQVPDPVDDSWIKTGASGDAS